MKPNLAEQTHRPWPRPRSPWVMAQTWNQLLFAHWALPPDKIRPLIPPQLELDTFDGQAWIGVVPFHMTGIRPRGLRGFPMMSAFAELNVRTYVTRDNKPGVWFFSLDAANRIAVEGARRFYHLPYFNAKMHHHSEGDTLHYSSQRTDSRSGTGDFTGSYRPISDVYASEAGTLDHWLTERYCLYAQMGRSKLYRAEIHHQPWSLQKADADIQTNTVTEAHGIHLPDTPPLLHYAHRLDIVAWYVAQVY